MMIALARPELIQEPVGFGLIVKQVLDSSEDVGRGGIAMNSLWHPFLIVLNVYLVHLGVHIK